MKVLIDNGHGSDTPGKCSPDGSIKEYAYAREIAKRLQEKLKASGIDARLITPETNDVSLTQRTKRANAICKEFGAHNCLLVSIHLDACPPNDGKWHSARGYSVRVSPNASNNSKRLARLIYEEAEKKGLKGDREVPSCKYWVQNLAICRDTDCPAVLTENLFQDNKEDVKYLLSEEGKNTIVNIHYQGILNYMK